MPSPATLLSVENEAMVGTTGATVSMVTLSAVDEALVLPARSLAVALRLWAPLVSAAVVKLQAPAPVGGSAAEQVGAVIDLHRGIGFRRAGSVRVLSLVMPSPATLLSVENEAMVGATGATVSMVTLSAVEASAGVAGDIAGGGGQAVGAVGERCGGEAPGAAAIGGCAAEQVGAVKDLHRGIGFRRAGQRQGVVIGDAVAHHVAVGRERGDGRAQPGPPCRW